jgi:ADP-ribosyl-[dinitrogen reductase] hydrolase
MTAVPKSSPGDLALRARAGLVDLRARARACLVGAAVGDALGAPVEFLTPGEIRARHGRLTKMAGGGWLHLRPGQVTDDTEMSLCLARSLVAGGWSPEDVARRFADWLRGNPIDVGNTCRRGISRYLATGKLWAPPSEGDAGNGAAMRVAPVALVTLGDPTALAHLAVEQARLTHNHPLSDAACTLVARLVQQACFAASRDELRATVDAATAEVPRLRFEPYRGLATGYVADTLQTVLHFFFTTATFEEALVATVNQGGDADTTGTILGAIAGAHYGLDQIPKWWRRKLAAPLVAELESLADALVSRSPIGQQQVDAG